MTATPVAAVAARDPNARSTRPLSPPGMKSVQLSRSSRRIASPISVARTTIQGPGVPGGVPEHAAGEERGKGELRQGQRRGA